jgi:hypothetical protein
MAGNLIYPLASGGGWGESKGPEVALNVNPDVIEKNIRRLEPRLQNLAISALRRRLDEMQGIKSQDSDQEQ